jgi:hypothetical protein
MAPGFAGLWQINVVLPTGLSGAVPVIVSVTGQAGNTVMIWVTPYAALTRPSASKPRFASARRSPHGS